MRERFRSQFAVLMVVAVLATTVAAAAALPTMGFKPEPFRWRPTVNESVWCNVGGWWLWQWGYCPSWIPVPKKLQPILQPDVPRVTSKHGR